MRQLLKIVQQVRGSYLHLNTWSVKYLSRKNAKVALGETREIAKGLAPFLVLEENSRISFGRNGKSSYPCSPG